MTTLIIKDGNVIVSNGNREQSVSILKIMETKTKKYHGKSYGYNGTSNRSKSWLTKFMDRVFFAENVEILPQKLKEKLSKYIADGWYYPKYGEQMKKWK